MMDRRTLESFPVRIPRKLAFRYLGIHEKGRRPRASLLALFEEECTQALDLMAGRAVMRGSKGGLPGSDRFDAGMPLVVVICTIGPALEERVRLLSENGESARAMVLDAIGSAAAEAGTDQCNRLICERAASTEYHPDTRSSPGYGTWDIRDQEAIFRFLHPEDIGVVLTGSCMMVPRKSVSCVVPLQGGKPGSGPGNRCRICGMKDCPFRSGGDERMEGDQAP